MKGCLEFFITPVPPFRLDLTVWALRRNPRNVIDRWDGRTYRRILLQSGFPVKVAVRQNGAPEKARLSVTAESSFVQPEKKTVTAALERLLGLRIDLTGFYRFALQDRQLKTLASPFRGMKPPRYGTVFESIVTAIASQQVSRTVSILILDRLAERHGIAAGSGDTVSHAFPGPGELAEASPNGLRRLGFSAQKSRAITELAASVSTGALNLDELAILPDEKAIERLRELRGIGRWSAEYVLLRGLGRTRIFPGDDVGARNNLRHWLHRTIPPDYDAVHRILQRWYPYAGLIYFHMLLNRLSEAGYIQRKEVLPMVRDLKAGDHVEWNSEAGFVRGTIIKKITTPVKFKGYTVHASKEEPRYMIKSDTTEHVAVHRGAVLRKIGKGSAPVKKSRQHAPRR